MDRGKQFNTNQHNCEIKILRFVQSVLADFKAAYPAEYGKSQLGSL